MGLRDLKVAAESEMGWYDSSVVQTLFTAQSDLEPGTVDFERSLAQVQAAFPFLASGKVEEFASALDVRDYHVRIALVQAYDDSGSEIGKEQWQLRIGCNYIPEESINRLAACLGYQPVSLKALREAGFHFEAD